MKRAPTLSPPVTLASANALRALSNGTADQQAQQIAWRWILDHACALGDWAFRPDVRDTDVMLGRQFAGQQIVRLARMSTAQAERLEKSGQREESRNG